MEWFWATVSYLLFAAIGGLVAFVFFYWLAAAHRRAQATERAREGRR